MLLTWGSSQGLNSLMNSAEFIAGFADKGSGEVDLTLAKGTGSATFTRATTATTVNSAGTIVSVASGTPRSYYDPTTLAYLGYLSEGARTNLCLQSADLSAADWLIDGGTKTAGFATAPDGTLSAGRYVTAAVANLRQVITVVASTQYTFSFYAKNNGGSQASYRVFNISGAADIVATTSYFSSINSSTFTRITVSFTTPVGCTSIGVYMNSNASADILLWGMQLEAGSFPSTYIPTTTASVTRNADVLTYPSAGNVSATEGTFYAESYFFGTAASASANDHFIIEAGDGTNNNRFSTLRQSSTNTAFFSVFNGGVNQAAPSSGVIADNTLNKVASTYKVNSFYLARNTTVSSVDSSGTVPSVTTIYVGCGSAGNQAFGTSRNVRIWQTQLSASQLQAVTG